MKMEKIREALHAQPFRPFKIHLADGGRVPVEHEDFVALDPGGREMIVFLPDGSHQIVEVFLITRLEIRTSSEIRSRKKR
jgi:hypothetical protein